jgi:hypothetical protein
MINLHFIFINNLSYLVIYQDKTNMFSSPDLRKQNGIRAQIEIDNIEVTVGETTYGLQIDIRHL